MLPKKHLDTAGLSDNNPITIRLAEHTDAALLAEKGAEYFTKTFGHLYSTKDLADFLHENYSPTAMAASLAQPDYRCFLAYDGAEMVGYAAAGNCKLLQYLSPAQYPTTLSQNPAELYRLYIAPSHQGAGIGALLMQTVTNHWKENGIKDAFIGVWSENYRAQRFYARYGFHKIGDYQFKVGQSFDHEFIIYCRNI